MDEAAPFNIEVSGDLAGALRARVASGEYANENEVIREGLELLAERDRPIEQWLKTDVAAAYDDWKADPSGGLTIDDVRQKLAEAREQRQGRA